MLMKCPALETYRRGCGVRAFIDAHGYLRPSLSAPRLYSIFISDNDPLVLIDRAKDLLYMYLGWHNLMGIPL